MERKEDKKSPPLAKSFAHAGRGVAVFFATTRNVRVHGAVFVAAVALGFFFSITKIEWMMLVLASGLVFATEAINTAIEIDMDLTSPEFHPYARDTKDVAAGAVLIAAITALVIGVLIFVPHLGIL
ncbi:MAG: hypothetical protein A2675_03375 [Candidatus Yonathbacteria bacterium RIFCSPHIGHO2_01_FULL_51_10]|uniref:Diacylglycerol kinase n=1 Tax=Candidatus Yonathbacteria bacterium RIFCSPHIGHO2_01_FULL_51_10 TaxID=1802723 RepID=A0A1G2S8T6_9BACT|nr:MAG: hypothetical protein A2675_03375 [Candidatus Yonathbacteria bacterium RIFCSPHIGHO2_01_FULL_51_10]